MFGSFSYLSINIYFHIFQFPSSFFFFSFFLVFFFVLSRDFILFIEIIKKWLFLIFTIFFSIFNPDIIVIFFIYLFPAKFIFSNTINEYFFKEITLFFLFFSSFFFLHQVHDHFILSLSSCLPCKGILFSSFLNFNHSSG